MLVERYEHTPAMAAALERIDLARALLEGHLDQPEDWHGVIRRQVMAAVVHYSTAIEGNVLTRDQVESIISGEAIEAPEKDRVEALNYFKAMRWAQTRSQDPGWRLTHETILTLHFMVSVDLGPDYEPLGRYRDRQNQLQDRRTGATIYWPPRVAEVDSLMDEFVDWARRRIDGGTNQYIVNALAHLNFVAIHPFSDGNGRVARLLCSLLMMRVGYKAQAFWSSEQFLGEHAREYGEVIAATLGPRWQPEAAVSTRWIEWYLDAVAQQVTQAAEQMQRSFAEFAAVLGGLASGDYLPAAVTNPSRVVIPVWLAISQGTLTRRQLARYVDLSMETLTRDLSKLVEQDLLARVGKGRAAAYVPGPVVGQWGPFEDLVAVALDGGASAVVERLTAQQTLFNPSE